MLKQTNVIKNKLHDPISVIMQFSKVFILFYALLFNSGLLAAQVPEVDIYRTDQISAKDIKEKFGNELKRLSELTAFPVNVTVEKNMKEMDKLGTMMIKGINAMGDFAHVSMESITYENEVV